jgi:hypothetical protein
MTRDERLWWHQKACAELKKADLVFLDPDNGLSRIWKPRMHKYALMSEVRDYVSNAQSVIVYHHSARTASARNQVQEVMDNARTAVGTAPLGAFVAHRGSVRFFIVVPAERHRSYLEAVVERFIPKWLPHIEYVKCSSG